MKSVSITVRGAHELEATASTASTPAIPVAVAPDTAAAARKARFGHLPEHVRYEDLVVGQPVTPGDPARDAYNAESAWCSYNCLALDLGL